MKFLLAICILAFVIFGISINIKTGEDTQPTIHAYK